MSEIAKIVGQRIRNYRTQQHLSQETLAEKANLHSTYIGQLERGEKNATLESIEKITSALKISMSQLFENIDISENSNNIPSKCYELIASKSVVEQEHLYKLLIDMENYKNK